MGDLWSDCIGLRSHANLANFFGNQVLPVKKTDQVKGMSEGYL